MSKFEFAQNIPVEVKSAIEEQVAPLEWLLPGWCQRCTVSWIDDGADEDLQGGALASLSCAYEYRQLRLYFYPSFVAQGLERRRAIIIHELIHGYVNVLYNYASTEIKRLLPEEDAPLHRSSVLKELEGRVESATQDLAFCILNLLEK